MYYQWCKYCNFVKRKLKIYVYIYKCSKIVHIIKKRDLTSVLNLTEATQKNWKFSWQKEKKNIYIYIYIYIYITNCRQSCFSLLDLIRAVLMSGMKVSLYRHLECPMHVVTSQSWQSFWDRHWKMASFGLEMGTMWLTGKPSVAWYCIGKIFLTFWHLSKGSSTGHNWINIFDNHKKDFCLLISYLFFLCISISVVVPSGNSSIRLGVEHCISKLQVVEEFDRRNGLNPCGQDEVIFTWFTRYSFLQFADSLKDTR